MNCPHRQDKDWRGLFILALVGDCPKDYPKWLGRALRGAEGPLFIQCDRTQPLTKP